MLTTLLNQTATIWNPVSSEEDDYGNDTTTYVCAGNHPCRIQPWKGSEFEFDRDTRRTYYRILLDARTAGVLTGRSRITLDTHSQRGTILDSDLMGPESRTEVYEVFGAPEVLHKRIVISHVEATLRTIEG
jgi:hypothetical protein